jgi:hypothetical protein
MVVNIREPETGASVLPQHHILNVMYELYVQIFDRIAKKQYPAYIEEYRERHGVDEERIVNQQRLIHDLADGLFAGRYTRDSSMAYLDKAMKECRWEERFDWEAMAVFDMLASQSLLAYFWTAVSDLASEEYLKAHSAGELRPLVDRLCGRALDIVTHHGGPAIE